jgi:hypothetical protein
LTSDGDYRSWFIVTSIFDHFWTHVRDAMRRLFLIAQWADSIVATSATDDLIVSRPIRGHSMIFVR